MCFLVSLRSPGSGRWNWGKSRPWIPTFWLPKILIWLPTFWSLKIYVAWAKLVADSQVKFWLNIFRATILACNKQFIYTKTPKPQNPKNMKNIIKSVIRVKWYITWYESRSTWHESRKINAERSRIQNIKIKWSKFWYKYLLF